MHAQGGGGGDRAAAVDCTSFVSVFFGYELLFFDLC
jgi:hypothetical protein